MTPREELIQFWCETQSQFYGMDYVLDCVYKSVCESVSHMNDLEVSVWLKDKHYY